MASLQEATDLTKKGLIWFGVAIVVIFIITMIVNFIKGFFAPPPPGPTACYGKLPQVAFPNNGNAAQYNYSINTLSGGFDYFSDRIVVPKITKIQPNLLALQTTATNVTNLGYTADPVRLSPTEYQWTKQTQPPKTLRVNIYSNDFTVISDFFNDPTVAAAVNLPDNNGATAIASTYANGIAGQPPDIDPNGTKVYGENIVNNALVETTDAGSTKILRVDLHQIPITNCYTDSSGKAQSCNIVYPNYQHSTMSFYVAAGQENENDYQSGQVVQANYFHRSTDKPVCPNDATALPTYPLITAQQAYDQLKKGNAYIAESDKSRNIAINNVSLALYAGNDPSQQYLVPVYVFEGNNGTFAAYVLALSE